MDVGDRGSDMLEGSWGEGRDLGDMKVGWNYKWTEFQLRLTGTLEPQ